jgi:hypothetical protein
MSTLYDTLTYAGSEKSFAAWGFSYDTTDELGNQKADVFTATIVGADISAEGDSPTFPFEAPIIVRTNRTSSTGDTNSFSGGSITFSGKRVGNPAKCTGKYEGVTYKFQGSWYDLSNTHFLQVFYGESDDGDNVSYLLPELVLNSSTAVTSGQILISVGDQIQAILQWLLDQYAAQGFSAPYQYIGRALDAGAINLNSTDEVYDYLVNESTTTIDYSLFALFLPSYIAKPMTCADAIQKCLQFSPRVTCSFDYSTSPPTFHAALVDTMTPVSLPLFDGVSHTSVNIQVRDDLLVRCVNIMYRSTYQVNGVTEVQYELDKWGPNGSNSSLDPDSGLRVVNEVVDLSGGSITTTTGHLDCEPVLATADSGGTSQDLKRDWWASSRGGSQSKLLTTAVRFMDADGDPTSIPDATIWDTTVTPNVALSTADLIAYGLCNAAGELLLNRLVSGTMHKWMRNTDGSVVVKKKVRISALMTFAEFDYPSSATDPDTDTTQTVLRRINSEMHHADIVVTNGLTGAYSTVSNETPGEAYIIGAGGIAQYLYNHLNVLQYEGDYAKVEVVFGTEATLRNAINFSGGATAWTTMKAQPQSIRRHYGKKTTEVQIGVAKHLNSGQLSALLNMWRYRRPWYNPQLRTEPDQNTTSNVDQALDTGNANSPAGLVNTQQSGVFSYSTPPDPTTSTPGVISAGIIHKPDLLIIADGFNY